VLDAFSVLAYLGGEPGADEVLALLQKGEPWMTLIGLGDVAYIIERTQGAEAAREVWANLRAEERPDGVPIRWLPIDDGLVQRAASIKARGGLSYADAFSAAAAAELGCAVLTGDREFAVVEQLGIQVRWLGPNSGGNS